MSSEQQEGHPSTPGYRRGPAGLGEEAAAALAGRFGPGEGVGAMEEAAFLQTWLADRGRLIPAGDWSIFPLISSRTAEHEVRYRRQDHRALKSTWPGTFGLVPSFLKQAWEPVPASPSQYLSRLALQNLLFADDIRLEGGMVDEGPSMIIGEASGGLSLAISQPWIDAADKSNPHPVDSDIDLFLRKLGFRPLVGSFYGWASEEDKIVMLDAKPDNFIETSAGILPIDLLLSEVQSTASRP